MNFSLHKIQLATGNWTFKVTRFGSRLQFMVKMAHYFAADFTEAKNEREKKDQIFLVNNIGYNVLRCTMVNFLKMSIILNSKILKVA